MKASPCSQKTMSFINLFVCQLEGCSCKEDAYLHCSTAQDLIPSSIADFLLELRKLMCKLSLLQFPHLKTKETGDLSKWPRLLKLCLVLVKFPKNLQNWMEL